MNVLSLFDGISCGQVAFERIGIKFDGVKDKYFASEIDTDAIKVTQHNYPNTIQIGDIFNLDYNSLPKIDIIIGGSPCTFWSISKSNREITKEGMGYKLFHEYSKVIDILKPKYFLYENNFSIHENIQKIIAEELGVDLVCINSALLSAQKRLRLYGTNIPFDKNIADRQLCVEDILQDVQIDEGLNNLVNFTKDNPTEKVNKLYRIGTIGKGGQGERVYSIRGKCCNLTANGGGRGAKTGLYQDKYGNIRKLTPVEAERAQTLPDNYTSILSKGKRYKGIGNGWTVDIIAHILSGIPKDERQCLEE